MIEVTPVSPTQIGNTVTIPVIEGVVYTRSGTMDIPVNGLFINAYPADGYVFTDGATTQWFYEYVAPPLTEVTPIAPTREGNIVHIPKVNGVVYSHTGDVEVADSDLVVTAEPAELCIFPEGAVAEWTFEYEPDTVRDLNWDAATEYNDVANHSHLRRFENAPGYVEGTVFTQMSVFGHDGIQKDPGNTHGVFLIDSEGNIWCFQYTNRYGGANNNPEYVGINGAIFGNSFGATGTGIPYNNTHVDPFHNTYISMLDVFENNKRVKFKRVVGGYASGAAIDIYGRIWSWGRSGENGHSANELFSVRMFNFRGGPTVYGSYSPHVIDYLPGIKFEEVTIGNGVMAARSTEGDLYFSKASDGYTEEDYAPIFNAGDRLEKYTTDEEVDFVYRQVRLGTQTQFVYSNHTVPKDIGTYITAQHRGDHRSHSLSVDWSEVPYGETTVLDQSANTRKSTGVYQIITANKSPFSLYNSGEVSTWGAISGIENTEPWLETKIFDSDQDINHLGAGFSYSVYSRPFQSVILLVLKNNGELWLAGNVRDRGEFDYLPMIDKNSDGKSVLAVRGGPDIISVLYSDGSGYIIPTNMGTQLVEVDEEIPSPLLPYPHETAPPLNEDSEYYDPEFDPSEPNAPDENGAWTPEDPTPPPPPVVTQACLYNRGFLDIGENYQIYWRSPYDYTVEDTIASYYYIDTESGDNIYFDIVGSPLPTITEDVETGYITEIETNLLGGMLGVDIQSFFMSFKTVDRSTGLESEPAEFELRLATGGLAGACTIINSPDPTPLVVTPVRPPRHENTVTIPVVEGVTYNYEGEEVIDIPQEGLSVTAEANDGYELDISVSHQWFYEYNEEFGVWWLPYVPVWYNHHYPR